jgi:hypothetical protein
MAIVFGIALGTLIWPVINHELIKYICYSAGTGTPAARYLN